jgi:hypothetical protein
MRDVEMPMAVREGHSEIAGGYDAIEKPKSPDKYYLGAEPISWSERPNRTTLLDCTCGCPGCWPLLCVIEVSDDEVTWRDFEQPHRGPGSAAGWWDYSSFAGFTFDKTQYLEALSVLRSDAYKQLQRTVIRHRRRGASASFHCALAPRWLAQRAAAELRR